MQPAIDRPRGDAQLPADRPIGMSFQREPGDLGQHGRLLRPRGRVSGRLFRDLLFRGLRHSSQGYRQRARAAALAHLIQWVPDVVVCGHGVLLARRDFEKR